MKWRAVLGLGWFVVATVALFGVVFVTVDLRKASRDEVVIGSKAFTESILLGEVMAQLVERGAGVPVRRRFNLGGTHICFVALVAGEIDLYAEYTGTGLAAILNRPAKSDPSAVLSEVRGEFGRRWGLEWLGPMRFNNTYALAMARPRAEQLGVRKVSDLVRHRSLVAGFPPEFMAREDGYPGLEKHYGLTFDSEPRSMEAGLMYGAVDQGKVDVISAYATDGRIEKLGLQVLEDDRSFFPPYQATPLIRRATLERHPKVRAALELLSGRLDDDEMRRLNADIDLQGRSVEEVATEVVDGLLR